MTFYATYKKKFFLKIRIRGILPSFRTGWDFGGDTPNVYKIWWSSRSLYRCNIPVSLHGASNLYWTEEIYDNLSILLREYLVDLEQKQANTKNRNNRRLLGIQDRLCRLDCFGSQAFKRANTPWFAARPVSKHESWVGGSLSCAHSSSYLPGGLFHDLKSRDAGPTQSTVNKIYFDLLWNCWKISFFYIPLVTLCHGEMFEFCLSFVERKFDLILKTIYSSLNAFPW